MVTTLIVIVISLFMGLIGAMLPTWRIPEYIMTTFDNSIGHVLLFDGYFPVTEAFQVAILIIVFETTILTARLIMGLVSIIRGGGRIEI